MVFSSLKIYLSKSAHATINSKTALKKFLLEINAFFKLHVNKLLLVSD